MKSNVLYTFEGNDVIEYTLKNKDLEIRALNYGASIRMIKAKNSQGIQENVVVDYDDVASYFKCPAPYMNAIVAPSAGRIAYGKYKIDAKQYTLSLNSPPNHLHGGKSGVSKAFFNVEEISENQKQILRFTLEKDHHEDGYNGVYTYKIDYILEHNTFTIHAVCTPKKRGIANLTSHLYFNLSGDLKDSINTHELKIPATKKTKIHNDNYPYKIEDIKKNSAFDFTSYKTILQNYAKGSEEFEITKGYDCAFLLNEGNTISLYDKESGRKLDVSTNQNSVVVYSANYFDSKLVLNNKQKGYPFCCIALETQDIPNAINILGQEDRLYDESHPFVQTTTYTFTTK